MHTQTHACMHAHTNTHTHKTETQEQEHKHVKNRYIKHKHIKHRHMKHKHIKHRHIEHRKETKTQKYKNRLQCWHIAQYIHQTIHRLNKVKVMKNQYCKNHNNNFVRFP